MGYRYFFIVTNLKSNNNDQVSISAQKKEEGELSIFFCLTSEF